MYPSSPKYNSGNFDHHHHCSPHQVVSSNDLGPLPISPHVNVPNAHSFAHMAPPPPLPPRVRRKTMQDFSHSQIRQAPDAPELPTRDQSPPPLPPRSHLHTNLRNMNENCWNHIPSQVMSLPASGCCTPQFKLAPQTSTIMMRRNSALEQQRKDSPQTPATPLSATSLAASPASSASKLSQNSPISVPPRKIR